MGFRDVMTAHGAELERLLLIVAGGGFLGGLSFVGDVIDGPPGLRPEVAMAMRYFGFAMHLAVVAVLVRIFAPVRLPVLWGYSLLLTGCLVLIASGGWKLVGAIDALPG